MTAIVYELRTHKDHIRFATRGTRLHAVQCDVSQNRNVADMY